MSELPDQFTRPVEPTPVTDGQKDHEAEMESMGDESMDMGDADKVQVEPGESAELTMTFDEPGTVLVGCHQPGHYDSGMKATATIS